MLAEILSPYVAIIGLAVIGNNSEQVLTLPPTHQTAKRYLSSLISNTAGLDSWQLQVSGYSIVVPVTVLSPK